MGSKGKADEKTNELETAVHSRHKWDDRMSVIGLAGEARTDVVPNKVRAVDDMRCF